MDIDDAMMRKRDKVGCSQYFADKIVTQDNSVKSNSEEVWKRRLDTKWTSSQLA